MIYLSAIIFGIVQGIAEFFPISSTGHLLIVHYLFPVFESKSTALSFDVALHVSVLLILLIVYGKRLSEYTRGAFRSHKQHDRQGRVFWFLVLGTIPALVVGFFFEEIITVFARSLPVVASTLIVGGILFLIVEWKGKQRVDYEDLSWWKALLIGCGQAVALIPGVSRSGSIIIAAMALGLKREAATHFAFLLAIPIFFLAGSRRLFLLLQEDRLASEEIVLFTLGFLVAAIVGWFSLRFLLRYVKTRTFIPFAIYRIALGGVLLLYLFFSN